jgi:hypothetical protein
LFVAAMGALAIFAPARRLLRYPLDLMHRKPLMIANASDQMSAIGGQSYPLDPAIDFPAMPDCEQMNLILL